MFSKAIILFFWLLTLCIFCKAADTDIYIIIYATQNGKTGHAGIAVDKYKIIYRELRTAKGIVSTEVSVKTGELIYYDFWPNDDYFNKVRTAKNIPGICYKLPEKIFEEITLNSLLTMGIPHKEHRPCDGLLRVSTSVSMDQQLIRVLDSMVNTITTFNAQRFNCTDFVMVPLEIALNQKINVKEFVLFSFSSTPNKLYRQLRRNKNVEIIRNADESTTGSFIKERVLFKFFH